MSDGESTNVGSIVGYLSLNRDQWIRDIHATEDDAKRLGALSPTIRIQTNAPTVITQLAGIRAASEEVGRQSPDVRVSSNAAEQTFQMHALRDAILLIGPAAVPIAGVAGGALIGLLPALGAVVLGIKGIADAEKSGQLQGTKYAADLSTLKTEATQLKQLAAGGLLNGLDQGLAGSSGLLKEVNLDIGVMSGQLGQIVGGAGPAFLSIFTQLNPLFMTIGQQLVSGAGHLEHWAQSTDGISKFVAYAQTELPIVEHDLGQVLAAAVHLTAGLAPMGNVALNSLGLVAHLINMIDPGHLSEVESVLISGYAAWRTYGAVSTIAANAARASAEKSVAAALATKMADSQAAAAAAESANVQAEAAREVAVAKAEAAQAAAESAVEQAAAAEQAGSADTAVTRIIAENAIEQAASFQAAADAATAAAVETATAAQSSADAVVAAGVEAQAGWTAALGPLAAVAIGVTLLSSIFGSNDKAAQENQQSINSYTDSLKQNADALAEVNISSTNKQLQDKGAFKDVDKLTASNKNLKLSYGDVTLAVNGNAKQYDTVIAKLHAVAEANKRVIAVAAAGRGGSGGGASTITQYNATGKAANDLSKAITDLHSNLSAAEKAQAEYNAALREAQIQTDGGNSAVAEHARLLGLTSDEYLTAQQAAKKNTDQTNAQTQAFQAAGDAASLLQQDLNGLAGQNLSNAQAQTTLASANLQVAASFKQNGRAIDGTSAAAVANQQAIQNSVSAAQQLALTVDKGAHSQANAVKSFKDSKSALEQQLSAQHKLTPAVQAYINKLYDLKDFNAYLKANPTPIDANISAAAVKLATIQAAINALHGKQVDIQVNLTGQGAKNASARADLQGGFASGGSVGDGWFTVGEQGYELGYKRGSQVQIYSNAQSKKLTGKDRVPGYASGTGDIVTLDPVKSKSHTTSSSHGVTAQQEATFANAAASLVIVASTLSDSYSQLRSSALALDSAARSAHVSESTLKSISSDQAKLLADASARDKLRAQLGTAPTSGTTAYDRLSAAQQAYASLRSSVSGSITGSYDFGAVAPGAGSNVNAQDFVDAGHSAVTNAEAFSADIKNLQSRGLNTEDVQSLVAKGPAAIAAANALVHSTASQLAEINAEHASLAGIAAGLGTAVADAADGATVKAAQTVVNGLIEHEKLLTTAMVNLAKAIGGKLAGHNASGTENWSGGWTWVGEQGPELMNLPAGSKIRSNAASRRMVQGGAGGSGTVVHVPTELVLRDIDGALIGRMKVEAETVVGSAAREFAHIGGWDT